MEVGGGPETADDGTNDSRASTLTNKSHLDGEETEEQSEEPDDSVSRDEKDDGGNDRSSKSSETNPEEKLCGWLHQRTRGIGNLKLTRQRWFVFAAENCKLYIYRDPQDMVPIGEICIATASFYFDAGNTEKPGLFQIKSDGKEFLLDAGNRHNMMFWLQALQNKRREHSLTRQTVGPWSLKSNSSNLGGLTASSKEEPKLLLPDSITPESIPMIPTTLESSSSSNSSLPAYTSRSPAWALGNLKSEIQQALSTIKITGKSQRDVQDSIFYADIGSDKGSFDNNSESDRLSIASNSSNMSSFSDQKPSNSAAGSNSQFGSQNLLLASPDSDSSVTGSENRVKQEAEENKTSLTVSNGTGKRTGSWMIIDKDQIAMEDNQSTLKPGGQPRERSQSDIDSGKQQGRLISTLRKMRLGKKQMSESAVKSSPELNVCPRCKIPVGPSASAPPALESGPGVATPPLMKMGSVKDVCDLEEELQANREIVLVLQKKLDEVLKELHSRQQMENTDEAQKSAMLVDKDKQIVELKLELTNMRDDYRRTVEKLRTSETELKTVQEQSAMYEDMLKAKDEVIMRLTNDIFDKDHPEQSVGSLDQSDVLSQNSNEVTLKYQTNTRELDKMKDMCQGYELQHKFLTKEILELNELRKIDIAREQKLTMDVAKLQAKYYQTKSKYFVLLKQQKEQRPPVRDGEEGGQTEEVLQQLLQDALESESEADDTELAFTSSGQEFDRYGFSRKSVFGAVEDEEEDPLFSKAVILERQSQEISTKVKEADQDASLRVKWENFMVSRGAKIQRSQELKNLIRHGVPHEYREEVWRGCVTMYVATVRDKLGATYYNDVVKRRLLATTSDPAVKQIELDLLRTLPNNKHYESIDSEGIPKLRKVLLAFSEYNRIIGYCQGLNRLAAIALLFLSEEDAFWCLVAIVDFILPQEYFSKTLMAAQADQRVLKDLIQEKLPRVHAHLEQHHVDLSLFTFNWFLTVFVDNVPPEMFLRIWDTFLYEGSKVLFRFAVAFLKTVEDDILKQENSLELNRYLRRIGEHMTNVRKISYIAFTWLNPFPMRFIASRRQAHLQDIQVELAELDQLRHGIKVNRESQSNQQAEYYSDDDLDS